MKRLPPARRYNRRGSIAVLAVIFLVVTIGFLAFSIDFGYMVVTESELQNAADSGALSGARALPDGRETAIAAAQLWAAKNVAAGQSVAIKVSEDVEIGLWDDDTASFMVLPASSSESPNAVRVTCQRTATRGNPLNLFFAPINGTKNASLTASAIAAINRDRCGVIVGLDYVDVKNGKIDSYDSDLGSYAQQSPRQHGDVCSDGPITLGSSGAIKGDALPGAGFAVNSPNKVTGRTAPRSTKIKWKPVDLSGVQNNNNNSISPGQLRNGQLSLTGGTVLTLQPGTYYFPAGIQMSGTSRIELTGPTRIVMGGNSSVGGNGIVNATQRAVNLRIDITDGSAFFGGNSALYADIYGPTAALQISGNAGFYGAAFGKNVTLQGSASQIHGDEALRREYDETARSVLKQ